MSLRASTPASESSRGPFPLLLQRLGFAGDIPRGREENGCAPPPLPVSWHLCWLPFSLYPLGSLSPSFLMPPDPPSSSSFFLPWLLVSRSFLPLDLSSLIVSTSFPYSSESLTWPALPPLFPSHRPSPGRYTYEIAPVFVLMEEEVLKKLRALVGWSSGDGVFCPGT